MNAQTASSKEFLDIQATIECGLTLKRVRDMTRTYSQTLNLLLITEKGKPHMYLLKTLTD